MGMHDDLLSYTYQLIILSDLIIGNVCVSDFPLNVRSVPVVVRASGTLTDSLLINV
jgi:hypothetical protein